MQKLIQHVFAVVTWLDSSKLIRFNCDLCVHILGGPESVNGLNEPVHWSPEACSFCMTSRGPCLIRKDIEISLRTAPKTPILFESLQLIFLTDLFQNLEGWGLTCIIQSNIFPPTTFDILVFKFIYLFIYFCETNEISLVQLLRHS